MRRREHGTNDRGSRRLLILLVIQFNAVKCKRRAQPRAAVARTAGGGDDDAVVSGDKITGGNAPDKHVVIPAIISGGEAAVTRLCGNARDTQRMTVDANARPRVIIIVGDANLEVVG